MDPTGNGLQLHRIDKSKDPNFWSARVNQDVRLIVHKTGESLLVAYVGHHDDAYAWAERRRIEARRRPVVAHDPSRYRRLGGRTSRDHLGFRWARAGGENFCQRRRRSRLGSSGRGDLVG